MEIFKTVEIPLLHRNHEINNWGKWYTWSDDCKQILVDLSEKIDGLPMPELIEVGDNSQYNKTFAIVCQIEDRTLQNNILKIAKSLYDLRLENELFFFTEMFDEKFHSKTIHYLFSYLQFYITKISKKSNVIIYAPLGSLSEKGFPFPLHLDLYLQKKLLVIFDNVPKDATGKTLLLPINLFFQIVDNLRTMDNNNKVKIRKLIEENHTKDKFEDFYKLLYQKNATWKKELSQRMRTQRLEIKFNRGEGILLHDRRWLHGRTSPSNGVPSDRLYRLTFNTLEDN